MLILSRVCADFYDKTRKTVFSITPRDLKTFIEAPEFVMEDPLFHMLVADGSLEASISKVKQKALENDPVADTDVTGKRKTAKASSAETAAGPAEPAAAKA